MAQEIIVELFPCTSPEGGDGESTVPAGSRVVLALGWGARNRGLMKNFLQAQTTTISINGANSLNISNAYSPIEQSSDGSFFVSRIHHVTGVTLSAGESLQVDGMLAVSHVVPDGVIDEVTHRPVLFRPEEPLPIHCRITASA